jgi:hypothetical protein
MRLIISRSTPLALIALFAALGCTGDSGTKSTEIVPAAGTVTVNGEPAQGVQVTLISNNKNEMNAFGISDAEGNFSCQQGPDRPGVPPGIYRVICTQLLLPDGSPLGKDASLSDFRKAVNRLPVDYSILDKSPIKPVELGPSGASTIEINITAKK